jgi:AcrR family transcriptional regulator
MTSISPVKSKRARAGRPRRLSLDAILDMAERIGFDDLDMKTLAEALDVGIATLYGYVSGRGELLTLVAGRQIRQEPVNDTGQSWQEAVRTFADVSYQTYFAEPSLIEHVIKGDLGPASEADHLDTFLAILLDRGFSPESAIALFGEIMSIVAGAAVVATNLRKGGGQRGRYARALRSLLDEHDENDLVALRRCAELRISMPAFDGYQPSLDRMLRDYAKHLLE